MMKKLLKVLLALSLAYGITGCSSTSDKLTGTYSIYVEGEDWGCGVNKVIITFDQSVSNVDKDDFKVTETKQTTDWTDETYPVIETTLDRQVEKAYTCDENGEEVSEDSKYVALELYISPSDGSPLLYTAATHYNTWSNPYQLNITLNEDAEINVSNTKVSEMTIDKDYTSKTTEADALKIDSFKASDGIEMEYGLYQPDSESDTLFVWLHGSGEGGTENTDPLVAALGNEVTAYLSDDFQNTVGGANVLVPQCPTYWMDADGNGGEWNGDLLVTHGPSYYTKALKELIDEAKEETNSTKVVVAGCSAGGYMAMRMILDYPDYFSAAIPICEAMPDSVITDDELQGIKDLPIYFIWSEDDGGVDPKKCEEPTINRLQELGASNVHYSTSESVVDTSGKYNDEDGNAYQYNGHWSWIYFDNNESKCNVHGESVWNWLGEQLK